VQVADILSYSGVPTTRQVLAGTGLTGGGQLTSNVTLSVAVGGIGPTQLANTGVTAGTYGNAGNAVTVGVDAQGRITSITTSPIVISGFVPTSRQVIAGVGLTGGGALTGNITLSAVLSASTPQPLDTTGSAGVSNEISRADHKHPAIDLADDDQVDGLLGLSNGGTARSLVANAGAIVYSGADGLYVGTAGSAGQVLVSAGTSGYSWGTAVLVSDQAANLIFAGPAAGPNAPVTFRSMVNADLPNSGVAANTYGSSTLIPVITVNAKGVITGVTTQSVNVTGVVAVANGGTGRTVGNYSIYANEIHVGKDGNDTTGDGTLINPVLTITKALTLVGAGRNTVIVHPGSYSESPTVSSANTTIATTELTGANTQISGTLTLSAAARISGIKITNLTITGSGNTYISNCTVDAQVVKSGTNYVEIINTELQCVSGVQITGAGTVSIVGNKCWAVAVSNASANVLIKDCFQVLAPSVTAGTLQFDGSAIFAASPASNAVTSSAGSIITLANCFVLNSAGTNVERVSLAGFYSILNLVYDKTNSTFAGTNLNAIDYFSVINADSLVLTNDLPIAQGGTGQSTASAAFNALSPITTTGDLILGNGANSATRLGIGANGYLLSSNGTTASWQPAPAGGVTTFDAGTTGFTPSTATSGAISLAGTLVVGNGGTGATTLTGYVKGAGTTALTASSTIPNTDITGLGTMSTQNATSVAITGGSINGTTVGATTAAAGTFTTVVATTGISGGTF
jgi:hypothetical protein